MTLSRQAQKQQTVHYCLLDCQTGVMRWNVGGHVCCGAAVATARTGYLGAVRYQRCGYDCGDHRVAIATGFAKWHCTIQSIVLKICQVQSGPYSNAGWNRSGQELLRRLMIVMLAK